MLLSGAWNAIFRPKGTSKADSSPLRVSLQNTPPARWQSPSFPEWSLLDHFGFKKPMGKIKAPVFDEWFAGFANRKRSKWKLLLSRLRNKVAFQFFFKFYGTKRTWSNPDMGLLPLFGRGRTRFYPRPSRAYAAAIGTRTRKDYWLGPQPRACLRTR